MVVGSVMNVVCSSLKTRIRGIGDEELCLLRQGTARVPGLKINGLVVELIQVLEQIALVDNYLVDVLFEEVVGHRVVALLAGVLTPGVLNPPAERLAAVVKVDASEHHGVGH